MKKIVTLIALLASIAGNASLVDSCANYKSDNRFIYMPIAQCKQVLSGNEGGQFTTLFDADICIVKTRNVKKKKTYIELSGSYSGKMDANSTLTSAVYSDSEGVKSPEGQILMVGRNSEATYQIGDSILHISNSSDNVDAILQCKRLR